MPYDFTGRTVVVTGTSGALGAGLAAAFCGAGARVIGVGRAKPEPVAVVAGVRYATVDVTDDAEVGTFFDDIGTPWAVVHTVGGFAPHTSLTALNLDELAGQLSLNLVTSAVITKHALRTLLPAGEGRLLLTASRAATVTKGVGFSYSVSKQAVLHLVRMAAEEVAGTGVTVNAVVPSIIDTPANRAAMPTADHQRWPTIPDIAKAYLYLASPDAHLVNGAALPV